MPVLHNESQHHGGANYNSGLNEAPMESPAELGYHGDPYVTYNNQDKGAANREILTVRYEM